MIFKNKIIKNAGYLIASRMVQIVLGLVVSLLTARYLGPSNYGLINYAAAYTGFFAAFCTLGINNVLVKEFIDHPGEEGVVIGTTLGLRAVSCVFSSITIIVISCLIDTGEPVTIAVVALASIGMGFQIFETFNYWFQSRLESKVTAMATLCAYMVVSAYKVFLLMTEAGVMLFALTTSLDYLCLGVILFVQYRKRNGGKLCFSWQYGKELFGRSRHFLLSSIMVGIMGQTDKLMLKHIYNEAETGYYATAITLCGMWCFILRAIIDSVQPSIMEAAKMKNETLFHKRNLQLYAIVFYISFFVAFFIAVLAEDMIGILYGASYLPAAGPLKVLTWHAAFSYLGAARNAWVVSKGCQNYLFGIYAASALTNVVLNCLLIPVMGAFGAAIASLVAQIFTTLVVPFFIKDMKENSMMILDAIMLKGILWNRTNME